ncbi:hypothetical protein KC19_8G180500 [Ceratodon purpureus]|uniref:TF-B3 domain-containing protein n=1 Tax=Ceratodon purpureus TaxID=3225 RepID=A0A8T0H8A0_CERPU|nr:hypothetical protein KC19_8G180500 [Ceratodon purpureus]KAG0565302.1 hypothetical protein KC19_8G180500 [Ceratodon purpureus]KAG0565303.1 hypothetical protein KC19_8G180500 [Ceratodon purpureus]
MRYVYQEVAKCGEHKRIVAMFETWPMIFFKVITKKAIKSLTLSGSDFTILDIPVAFTEEYTEVYGELSEVRLERAFGDKVWPVVMKKPGVGGAMNLLFLHGYDGWRKFFEENGVKEGDILVFQVIEKSRFIV